jgi:hypothetical protein
VTTRWERDPRVVWRRCLDRTLIQPPGHDEPLVLNATGRLVWELLDEPLTEPELVATLADVFDRDTTEVAVEVTGFLSELREVGGVVTG